MRNVGRALSILQLLRKGLSNNKIASELHLHRNTVSRYVNWLRRIQIYETHLIVNKIDSQLDELMQLSKLEPRDLIMYRRSLTPRQFEGRQEITLKQEVPRLDVKVFSIDELAEIQRVSRLIRSTRNTGEESP